jgi:predicted DNA-binding transcriptional regulator AlpA
MARQNALPSTLAPRLISREAAAAYVSVSPNMFDAMVEDGRMPRPKRLSGRRNAWDVRALDAAVDALPVYDDGHDETWNDIDAAYPSASTGSSHAPDLQFYLSSVSIRVPVVCEVEPPFKDGF